MFSYIPFVSTAHVLAPCSSGTPSMRRPLPPTHCGPGRRVPARQGCGTPPPCPSTAPSATASSRAPSGLVPSRLGEGRWSLDARGTIPWPTRYDRLRALTEFGDGPSLSAVRSAPSFLEFGLPPPRLFLRCGGAAAPRPAGPASGDAPLPHRRLPRHPQPGQGDRPHDPGRGSSPRRWFSDSRFGGRNHGASFRSHTEAASDRIPRPPSRAPPAEQRRRILILRPKGALRAPGPMGLWKDLFGSSQPLEI